MNDVIEAEVVEDTGTVMLATTMEQSANATLFHTDDPVVVLERATVTANALATVINQKSLFATIKGNNHVLVEGWLTLGAMLGVSPICTWTRETDKGWEARVEVRTLDNRLIGAAEAMGDRTETRWRRADGYANWEMPKRADRQAELARNLAECDPVPDDPEAQTITYTLRKSTEPERMRGLLSDYGVAIAFDDHERLRDTAKAIRRAIASGLAPSSDAAY